MAYGAPSGWRAFEMLISWGMRHRTLGQPEP